LLTDVLLINKLPPVVTEEAKVAAPPLAISNNEILFLSTLNGMPVEDAPIFTYSP
jgi:hypothetical protein